MGIIRKIVPILLLAFAMYGEEPFATPDKIINMPGNKLRNSDFSRMEPVAASKIKSFVIDGNQFPTSWRLLVHGKNDTTEGNCSVLKLGQNRYYLSLTAMKNTDNGVELLSDTLLEDAQTAPTPLYVSFWARGKGIIHLRCHSKEKDTETFESILVTTDEWHFYRTRPLTRKSALSLGFSVYGKIDLAMPEVAPMPAVDPGAELVFYAPFEKGSPRALFSVGQTGVIGIPDAPQVPGQVGDAIRLDRRRRLTATGFLRYPMGFLYDFMENVLDPECGTLELYLRPLPEMLEPQQWMPFPIFYVGDTTWQWPNSQDFDLSIHRNDKTLRLVLNEYVRQKRWPDGKKMPNTDPKNASYRIEDTDAFIGKWHHLAFTYDRRSRTVWLDGKPVIQMEALKSPAISSRIPKIIFANGNLSSPAVISSDIDEFKIYRGVRYHAPFTPSSVAPTFQTEKEPRERKFLDEPLRIGPAEWSPDGTTACFPIFRGTERYRLELSLGDGYPLIFSARNANTKIRVDHDPSLPNLACRDLRIDGNTITGIASKSNTSCRWTLHPNGQALKLSLELSHGDGRWKAFLEPRITLRRLDEPWTHCYDGYTGRDILIPFKPFAFANLFLALPMAGAWNCNSGLAVALAPEIITSWISRGMTAPNALQLAVRTVLDAGDKMVFKFDLFAFNPAYGEADAIDRYHAASPAFFRLDPKTDPRVYGNLAISNVWQNGAYRKRSASFSFGENTRRTRGRWCWFYYSAGSTGNWALDPEVLCEFPPVNIPHLGDMNFHSRFKSTLQQDFAALNRIGIDPLPYISSWADGRLCRYFNDSLFGSEGTYNGIDSWENYWCRGVIDHIMMPSGTSYGEWFRNSLKSILKDHPLVNAFSYDLCGYRYYFRKANRCGGLRAFDEEGEYVQHVAALGQLLDYIRALPNATGFNTAVNTNVDAPLSSFNTVFRSSNNLHEQASPTTMQAKDMRQQQTRLMGEKPTVFLAMPPLVGNYFNPREDDRRLMRYAAVAFHHRHILLGMLFNIKQNWEIAGVKESMMALDDLDRVQRLGYRQTVGAAVPSDLAAARYGEIFHGVLALVNGGPTPKPASVTMNQAYFQATPLIAVNGREINVSDGTAQVGMVPPLGYCLVELIAVVPDVVKLQYRSALETRPDGRTLTLQFFSPARLAGLKFGMNEQEELKVTQNGKPVSLDNLTVSPHDVLCFATHDRRYLSSAAAILEAPYLQDSILRIACGDGESRIQADRIAEFFRYWTKINHRKLTVELSSDPAGAVIVLENKGAPGIERIKNTVYLRGQGRDLVRLTDEFLKLLDHRYPYYGVFGVQQPTKELDDAPTGQIRRFNQATGLIGKTQSTQAEAKEFVEFLKDQKINIQDGF